MITITSAYCTYYDLICLYLTVIFGTNDKKLPSTIGIVTEETLDDQTGYGETKIIFRFARTGQPNTTKFIMMMMNYFLHLNITITYI
jgi:hypothetical protein